MPANLLVIKDTDNLRWVQPVAGNRYHELRSRRSVHAKLKWKGMYGSLAYVHTDEGTFTLKRAGFLNPRVTVRVRPEDRDIAVFEVNIGITGTVRFRDGRGYEVARPNALRRRWTVRSLEHHWDDRPLLIIEKKKGPKYVAEVHFRGNPRSDRYLVLTSAVVWYAFVLSNEDWNFEPEGQSIGSY